MARAQAIDAHSSFVYLVDNLPIWRDTISSLSTHAIEKNADFVAEYTRLVHQARPRRKKTPSVSSIHTEDGNQISDQANAASSVGGLDSPDPGQMNLFEAGNKYLYAQARRKRKPGPSIRSGASGPQKFRNRNHVIVHYDGYLQEQLNIMVKQVGAGRNTLRKGKAALAAAQGFCLPTLNKKQEHELSAPDDFRPAMVSRSTSHLLPAKKLVTILSQPATTVNEESFVHADKELEQIQSLCETAAHQFLRDGDCKTELVSIWQRFDTLLESATGTAKSLEQLQAEHQEASHALTGLDGMLLTQPSLNPFLLPKISRPKDFSPLALNYPLGSLQSEGCFSASVIATADAIDLAADTIEVDDASDQESIDVDPSLYRFTNPRRTRA